MLIRLCYFFLLIGLLPGQRCYSQVACNATYQKLYGGNKADFGNSIVNNPDGSSVLAGSTSSFGSGGSDGYIQKVDINGNLVWSVAIGGTGNEFFQSISRTNDGGYIAVGSTTSFGGSATGIAWMAKVDGNGTLQWARKYDDGNPDGSIALDVTATSDGGYAISGTNRYTPGLADAMLIKTDNLGNVQWAKSFNSGSSDQSYGVLEDADSLVVSAFQFGQASSLYNGVIMKIKRDDGTVFWARNYDIEGKSNWFTKIFKTTTGYGVNIYDDIAFSLNSPEQVIVNTDRNGNPENVYKITNSPLRNVGGYAPTSDSGFVVTQADNNNNADIHLIKVDKTGGLQWTRKIAGTGLQSVSELRQLPDKGYIMTGYNNSTPSINDSSEVYIIRTDSTGDTKECTLGTTTAVISIPSYNVDLSYTWLSITDISFTATSITALATNTSPHKRILCETKPLNVDFAFSQDVCNPKLIQFTTNNTETLNWDLGDGTLAGNNQAPTELYPAYGIYNVKLKATPLDGCADSVTKKIPVTIAIDSAIITSDTSLCFTGNSFQLNALPGISYCWSPATGLSNTSIANPVIANTLPTTTYSLNALVTGQNLVTNGDFSSGNTGFTSEYTYTNGHLPLGGYLIDISPAKGNIAFASCSDHTTGKGNMMVMDGASVPNVKVWRETITISPNTNYAFSCWIESIYQDNPAKLQFYVNGNLIGNVFNASSSTCQWQQFYAVWNSGDTAKADIAIVNQNTASNGNDFALDDISFSELKMIHDSVTIAINPNPKVDFTYTIPLCKTPQLQGTPVTAPSPLQHWNWYFGDNTTADAQALSHTYIKGGSYPVKLVAIDANTCKDSITKTIQLDTITAAVTADTTVCPNSTFTLHGSGGETYEWQPASLLDDPSSPTPTATIGNTNKRFLLTIKNSIQCEDTASVLASIFKPDFVRPADEQICMDSSIQLNPAYNATYQYTWSPASSLDDPTAPNPIASPRLTTVYTLTVKEPLCGEDTTFKINVRVNPLPFFVLPNAFTPNGDGVNDCFGISKWGNATIEEFEVYTRWGEKVFSTKNTSICWDGTYKGNVQPAGTYVYVIKAKTACGNLTEKGFVILMR